MADGSFETREIRLDLAATPAARVIRAAGQRMRLRSLSISGTSGADFGIIVLRKDNATGPIIFQFTPAAAGEYQEQRLLDVICDGLFMSTVVTAWAANSIMMIYTE